MHYGAVCSICAYSLEAGHDAAALFSQTPQPFGHVQFRAGEKSGFQLVYKSSQSGSVQYVRFAEALLFLFAFYGFKICGDAF